MRDCKWYIDSNWLYVNFSAGYPGGRHLSERDLPSKVLEHGQDTPAPSHLHQGARIQASKSVPSLNSKFVCVYVM